MASWNSTICPGNKIGKRYPKSGQAGRAHAHLQNEYNINFTLGGTEED
jgi:hypothetical protein